jgi:hypothetical protein
MMMMMMKLLLWEMLASLWHDEKEKRKGKGMVLEKKVWCTKYVVCRRHESCRLLWWSQFHLWSSCVCLFSLDVRGVDSTRSTSFVNRFGRRTESVDWLWMWMGGGGDTSTTYEWNRSLLRFYLFLSLSSCLVVELVLRGTWLTVCTVKWEINSPSL